MKDFATCIWLVIVVVLHTIGMYALDERVYFILEAVCFVMLFGMLRYYWITFGLTKIVCDWCMGLALSHLIDEIGCLVLNRCDIFKPVEFSLTEWLVALIMSVITIYRFVKWRTNQI